jgi:hypothetical protein
MQVFQSAARSDVNIPYLQHVSSTRETHRRAFLLRPVVPLQSDQLPFRVFERCAQGNVDIPVSHSSALHAICVNERAEPL